MIVERNECCDCATENYPCLGEACTQRHKLIHVCDSCETDSDQIYYFEDGEYCLTCIESMLMPVDV